MKRNLILTVVLLFVYLSNSFSQCNDPAAPGLSCQSAIAFCDNEIDGYCSATYNSGVGTVVDMPPFCGSVQNNLWLEFVAGSNSISLEFTIDNCLNGDGLQVMVLHTDDCNTFTGMTDCYTESTSGGGGGTSVFTLAANNYTIGETYFIMIDGWLGDYCDFSIEVVQGSTGVAPLTNPGMPSGDTQVCPGANSITYSIPAVPNATDYNWSVPSGATYTLSPDELSITVNFSTFTSSGSICVQAINGCDVSTQTCLPVSIQNLPPANDTGAYCAGSVFFYDGNNTSYTEGIHYITLPGASYQGCDSIVMLTVTENPIEESFHIETICQGESIVIGGIPFTTSNSSIAVTLSSVTGCDSIVNLDLTVLDPQAIIQQPNAITCSDQNVTINAALSNADSYNWTTSNGNIVSGQGTPLLLVDASGTYELTVTKSHQGVTCSATSSVTIVENSNAPSVNLTTTDVSCFENNNGIANAAVSGGVPPYTYAWSNGGIAPTINNLSPGSHTVTITGGNGCETIENFIITEPFALNYNIVLGNVSCHEGANGTGSISANGGTSPYTYQWSSGSTLNFEAGLSAGIYEVTVTDGNACTVVEVFEIFEPDPIDVTINETQPLCNGELGSATVIATGGGGMLNYLWSGVPVQTTATVDNLSIGTHSVTVTDQNGCFEITSVNIEAPVPTQIDISGTAPTCFTEANGTAIVDASGGSGSFSYEWNTNPPQYTNTISNLFSGTYEVTVTDQSNCIEIVSIDLNSPPEIIIDFSTQDLLCNGAATGSITAMVSGGVGDYSYAWDDLANQNTITASNLIAGSYTLVVTDDNNCTAEATVVLNEPVSTVQISGTTSDATCGSENGSIDLSVIGGTGPYTFEWTSGIPSVEDPTGLGAGTYSVIVTDINGCSETASISVNTPTGLEAMIDIVNVSCNGGTNGAMDITISGGTSPYTFEWSEPSNNGNEDFLNISANDYSVTITDSDGCSVVAAGIVEEPEILTGIINVETATCGGSDGSISLIINGGTAPFDFDWSQSAYDGMQNLSDLMPGYYSVLITDANGCSINLATDVIIPDGPSLSILATDANCAGENSGSLDLIVSGGLAPYSFVWDNGLSAVEDQNNLPAGNYTVTVTDQNNCTAVINELVSESPALSMTLEYDALTCFGGHNGSASVTASGGVAPYSFVWSNGQTGTLASGLDAGIVSVTLTDANNCTNVESIDVLQPSQLVVLPVVSNVSCNGGNDANIDLVISGGTGAYNFNWSNGAFSEDIFDLSEGDYDVTVTDGLGCTAIVQNILVSEPDIISVTYSSTMAFCNTANGSIDLNISGGTGPYTFLWDNGVPAVEDPSGLTSGSYGVTVSDANGCTAIAFPQVASPSGLSATAIVEDALCSGTASGSIDVSVIGGLAPFEFTWSNSNETTEDLSNLLAGVYNVTIVDANNCSTTTSAIIEEPDELSSSALAWDATCGESNGAIFLTVSGGTAPYVYNWNNGSAIEDPTALATGVYDVTITDANGCTGLNSVTVETPNQLSVVPTVLDTRCVGDASGAIDLAISGGEAPYSFNWSNGALVQNPAGLLAGVHSVTITDNEGCPTYLDVEIFEPEIMSSTVSTNFESCNNSNGSIDITITGGTPPYNYEWQDGIGNMEDPIGLNAGVYFVTVTDDNDCEYVTNAEVLAPPPYFINAITTDLACNGASDASVNLNVEGGVPPYSFVWNTGQNTEDLDQLPAGLYTVTITDSEDCSITYDVDIDEPVLLEAFVLEPINVSCFGLNDGGIVLEVIGGTPEYTFDWNDDLLDGLQNPSDLSAGTYEVTVSDSNGCNAVVVVDIEEPTSFELEEIISEIKCFNGENGAIDISISGGTMPYSYNWNNGISFEEDLINIGAGQYNLQITDANGCIQNVNYELENPPAIQVGIANVSDYNGFNLSCDGESDGFVELNASGGISPYQYLWNNGSITNDLADLVQGTYTITVTDANGCTIENEIEMTAPAAIDFDLEPTDPSCYNENDGQILVTNTSGGMSPYIYALDDAYFSTSNRFNSLISGNYKILVQDVNGCESSNEIEIINPNELQIDLGDERLIQLGDSIQLEPIFNIPLSDLDTFIWQSGNMDIINPWVRPTTSTSYSLTIINDNGCIAKDDLKILVQKDRLVYLPNIFTPNNDGINDVFFPQVGAGVEKVNTFQIFDRWGEIVFDKSDFLPGNPSNGWDGKLRDEPLNNGVFIYFLEVEFLDGRIEIYSGDLTLIK